MAKVSLFFIMTKLFTNTLKRFIRIDWFKLPNLQKCPKWEKLLKKHLFFLPDEALLIETRHREHPEGFFYQKQGIGNIRKGFSIRNKALVASGRAFLSEKSHQEHPEGHFLLEKRHWKHIRYLFLCATKFRETLIRSIFLCAYMVISSIHIDT